MNTTSATARQLAYLRMLADQTATTFAYPTTRRQASSEIARLKRLLGRGPPLPEPSTGDRDPQVYATAAQDDELAGWGASATWRGTPPANSRSTGRSVYRPTRGEAQGDV